MAQSMPDAARARLDPEGVRKCIAASYNRDVARQHLRFARCAARRPVGSLLAVSLCLALGLLGATPGSALAISGYATPGPSVSAQYPDLDGEQPGVGESLQDLFQATRMDKRDPKLAAHWRASAQKIARKAEVALASAARISAPESGSIGLLVAGVAALSSGGVLRWRRGRAQT